MGVLWLARSAMKRWIDGPEVTPGSGAWPDDAGRGAGRVAGLGTGAGTGGGAAGTADGPTGHTAGRKAPDSTRRIVADPAAESPPATAKKPTKSTGKRAAAPSRRRTDSSAPGSWIVPNGTAEVLVTHPVKVKLSSRVYRVPGMPMYDRTVADRCYATVEAAEADGFNRAAR